MVAKRQKNAIEKNAAELAALGERMKAAKAPAKRKPRAKKPGAPITRPAETESTTTAIPWKTYAKNIAFGFAMLTAGVAGGWWSAGGIEIGPGPIVRDDSLSQAHVADRVSQVRILREYAGKTFADEPAAQAWLNKQRSEASRSDWIPYTDELGAAADAGVDAVKALADKLEKK